MKINDAIDLIKDVNIDLPQSEYWADLGCGQGMFTKALASILPQQSTLFAIDKNNYDLQQTTNRNVKIEFLQADFEKSEWSVPKLDGILMANSLHYVADKETFLFKLQKKFKRKGRFIIVEYDTLRSNNWVPYPIDFIHLKDLFFRMGFENINKIGEHPSIYGPHNIYAAYVF